MVSIRNCNQNDSTAMLQMLKALDKETEYMMLEPDERTDNPAIVENVIKNAVHGDDFLIFAEDGNELVGFLSAERGTYRKIKHSAYLVVGIRQAYRGQGIGTQMFQKLDEWATKQNITRLELTVMCPNLAARHLYEKAGFVIEGIKKNSIYMNGAYIDEYYMAKLYHESNSVTVS